ncbi:MAG: DNA-binding response regulator [Zetaproteobacteria bacterium]|nr:MAG: DNA-binding response regulator [Zetaproteobacteria bacterium]
MSESPREAPPGTTATVFVVDDEDSVRKALARLIRSAGMTARTFPTAEAFLAENHSVPASCLVLDVGLPGLNGLQLQEALNRRGYPISIIFITGHGDVPMSVRAMKAGAVDFLQKPFAGKELLEAIRRAVDRTRDAVAKQTEATAIQQRYDTLTPREREVFSLVVSGLLNKQVAGELGAAEKTIKIHRGRVMAKMQAPSLADLVRMAALLGIPAHASTGRDASGAS